MNFALFYTTVSQHRSTRIPQLQLALREPPRWGADGGVPVASRDRDPAFGTEVGLPKSDRASLVMSL